MREVVNGLMYILSTGCQWRAIPRDLPPKSSVYDYFDLWTYDGTLERIHYALYEQCREREQREASPTAAIIDSQSVKSAEKDAMGASGETAVKSSLSNWLVAGLKKLEPNPEDLLKLLHGWRDEAIMAGRPITRIAVAYETGRDSFWLARWGCGNAA